MEISDDYSRAIGQVASELHVTTSALKKIFFTILEALPESSAHVESSPGVSREEIVNLAINVYTHYGDGSGITIISDFLRAHGITAREEK